MAVEIVFVSRTEHGSHEPTTACGDTLDLGRLVDEAKVFTARVF
jgi:hypothetical protein